MKTFVKLLIIIGVLVLVSGAIIFSIGLSKNNGVAKESKTYDIENPVSDFKFDIDTSNVEFKLSDDGTSKVVYEDTAKIKHVVEVLDNTLSIKKAKARLILIPLYPNSIKSSPLISKSLNVTTSLMTVLILSFTVNKSTLL